MKKKVYEVYLDRYEFESNDNYSCFIRSNKRPSIIEATKILKAHNKIDKGYNVLWVINNTWEDLREEDIINA